MPLESYELNAIGLAIGFLISGILVWGWIIVYGWYVKRYK